MDWVLRSPIELPGWQRYRYRSIWEMLFSADAESADRTILMGAADSGPIDVRLADLQVAAIRARRWCLETGLRAGDTLTLVRLPRTSEVPLAAAMLALMASGIRVVLPMGFDPGGFADMLLATSSRGVLWCTAEPASAGRAEVAQADRTLRDICRQFGLPAWSVQADLQILNGPVPELPDGDAPDEFPGEALVLTTSGSTGAPKLVRYTQRALLTVAEAWQAAGLMSEDLTGGRSICPLLSHSMGVRNVLHAVWNRRPTLLVQPEWLEEQPKRFLQLLERCLPQHITCGPALLHDLGLLARSIARARKSLSSLRCVVSSGAATATGENPLPGDVRLANAFGMTEVQQVLSTLVGAPSEVPGALGAPLPGVTVGVQYTEPQRRIGRLFVQSPFSASGYVGQPDFGPWFDTGDLVRCEGDSLVWLGRAEEDFLNTGLGWKVAIAELRETYRDLAAVVEDLLFFEASRRDGLVALAFVGARDPADKAIHAELREVLLRCHRRLEAAGQSSARRHTILVALACVPGRPPLRGPGKTDRQRVLREHRELLEVMGDPAAEHSQVIEVPSGTSDAPNWRRYAAPLPPSPDL